MITIVIIVIVIVLLGGLPGLSVGYNRAGALGYFPSLACGIAVLILLLFLFNHRALPWR